MFTQVYENPWANQKRQNSQEQSVFPHVWCQSLRNETMCAVRMTSVHTCLTKKTKSGGNKTLEISAELHPPKNLVWHKQLWFAFATVPVNPSYYRRTSGPLEVIISSRDDCNPFFGFNGFTTQRNQKNNKFGGSDIWLILFPLLMGSEVSSCCENNTIIVTCNEATMPASMRVTMPKS